jgi:capsular polysaccharide biosynthesis protein
MLEKLGIDVLKTKIVVASELNEKPYFQLFKEYHPLLSKLRWIIQDKQDIYHDTAVFCKPLTHRLDLISDLVSPIHKLFFLKGAQRRFFVTRSTDRNRHISNTEQIHDVLKTLDFEVIDCDNMTLQEQINWFGNASHIVAIHGAGLANLIYANNNTRVYEIFPPEYKDYLPFHYILLCRLKNIKYQCSIGQEIQSESNRSFYVNPIELELKLRKFLAN